MPLDFLADVVRVGGSGVGAGVEGGFEGEDGGGFGGEGGVDGGEIELVEGGVGFDGLDDGFADEFVGMAEGGALFDEPIGEVGGKQHGVGGGCAAAIGLNGHGGDHFGVDGEGELEGVEGVEERFFVFLEVAIVGEREAFEGGEEGDEVAEQAAGFAAGDFADVGIFFLRHEG